MSGVATGWALRNGPRDRAERAVLIVLADAANTRGEHARPGLETIVERSLYSEGHVRRCLASLIEGGYIEQTRKPGPGTQAEYRVLMKYDEGEPPRSQPAKPRAPTRGDGPTARANGARNGARTRPTRTRGVAGGIPISPITETGNGHGAVASKDAPGRDATIESLCERLATAVGQFGDRPPPPVTERWRRDMRLLLERGPRHRRDPEPMVAERVESAIITIFTDMADPGRDGFCWAAQIRSPAALRDHWDQLRVSHRQRATKGRNGSDPMKGRHKRTLTEEMRLALEGGET